jgi:Na+/phosphate symporter
METQDVISAVTVVFIVGMIWLRTRVLYTRQVRGVLQLQRAGRIYFAAVLAVLVLGWLVAPLIGRLAWPDTNVTPLLMRVIWFLATYYVFIVVHRILKGKGVEVYKAAP